MSSSSSISATTQALPIPELIQVIQQSVRECERKMTIETTNLELKVSLLERNQGLAELEKLKLDEKLQMSEKTITKLIEESTAKGKLIETLTEEKIVLSDRLKKTEEKFHSLCVENSEMKIEKDKLIFELNEKIIGLKNENSESQRLVRVYFEKFKCLDKSVVEMGKVITDLRHEKLAANQKIDELMQKVSQLEKLAPTVVNDLMDMPVAAEDENDNVTDIHDQDHVTDLGLHDSGNGSKELEGSEEENDNVTDQDNNDHLGLPDSGNGSKELEGSVAPKQGMSINQKRKAKANPCRASKRSHAPIKTAQGRSGYYSRCSVKFFYETMEKLELETRKKHLKALKSTPFHHYIDMPRLNCSFERVKTLVRRFQVHNTSFLFGQKPQEIEVPFLATEFSIVLGLQHAGQSVHLGLDIEHAAVTRLFPGKNKDVLRNEIARLLEEYAHDDSEDSLEDFRRLYILLVFNCILFPKYNYKTPKFLLPYVDNLSLIGLYAWGEAAYKFLVDKMSKHLGGKSGEDSKRKYLDGCTIGLMAWVYERIPSLATPTSLHKFPRICRWGGKIKLPTQLEEAEKETLTKITKDKVYDLYPMPEEEKLLAPIISSAAARKRG